MSTSVRRCNYKSPIINFIMIEVSTFFAILTALLALRYCCRIKKGEISFFYLYVVISALIDTISYILLKLGIHTGGIYNISSKLDFLYWGFIFYTNIENERLKVIQSVNVIVILLVLIAATIVEQKTTFNTAPYLLQSGGMVAMVVFYFSDLMISSQPKSLHKIPLFYCGVGLLLMYSGGFFYFGFLDTLMKIDPKMASNLYIVVLVLNILLYISYSLAIVTPVIWMKSKK